MAADPIEQFKIHKLADFGQVNLPLFGPTDLAITNSHIAMTIAFLLIVTFLTIVTTNMKVVPGRTQAVGEQLFSMIDNLGESIIGHEGKALFPFIFTVFSFILALNLLGLFATFAVTSQLAITATFAVLTIGLVLIIGFAYQNELMDLGQRLRGALFPGYAVQTGAREMTISEGEDGHYHVYGTVNGVQIAFLIDTGATDIVLDPDDARRIGLKLEDLTFDKPFGSANGVGHGASIEVDTLSVGPIQLTKVRMSVNGARMGSSLLGMAFLKQLKSYSFSGGKLTLRW